MNVQAIEDARRAGDLAGARELLQEAGKKAGGMDAHLTHQYALVEMASGRYGQARDAFLLLTTSLPHGALLWFNAARCSEILGEYEVARHAYQHAIEAHRLFTQQNEARSYFGMGAVLFRLGDNGNAEAFWREGLEKPCDSDSGVYERSQVKLALGQYTEDAWTDYEARKNLRGYQQSVEARTQGMTLPPEWDGKADGNILLVGGQGAGDVIMFSRYADTMILGRSYRVVAGEPLERIAPRLLFPIDCQYWCALDSLPLLLRAPEPIPPTYVMAWARPQNTQPRIGVCWKGSPKHLNDKDRSCPYDFRPVLADERWNLVSLQEGHDFNPKDYLETAEVMRTLDAVVTVDTSTAHLAGTLGVPTVLIPPTCPEYRWGLPSVARSPWYPSIEIIRRKNVSDWSGALSRVKAKLTEML